MQIIADLHLHSKYSRAVSQKMDLIEIASWAQKKGISLVTTGDWTHYLWIKEIKNNLKEISHGIYSLVKNSSSVGFLLTTEISSIYVQDGKQRRIHNLIFSPSIATVEKIINELKKRGANLMSDGRPIIGLSSKNLLEMLLEIDNNIMFIPCHIWTPWFSLFGSKSGFDSIKESFGDLEDFIYGIETGLSSDPIMNWQIKELDNRSILSFSDAHSGAKLGREATVFIPTNNQQLTIKDISYYDIIDAIKQKPDNKLKIGYTIEFFPEEGKYHWSGHRNCNIRYNTKETKERGEICPVCKKPLTIGVENRVMQLSEKLLGREDLQFLKNKTGLTFVYDKEKKRRPFVSLVPLLEILTEVNNSQTKAFAQYQTLISDFACEFDILQKKSYEEIENVAGPRLSEAIKIMRERKVFVDPGYDGVFGKVKIFDGLKTNSQDQVTGLQTEKQPTLF